MARDPEDVWRQIQAEHRDPDAQEGFTFRQVMLDDRIRIPLISAWLDRRRERRA